MHRRWAFRCWAMVWAVLQFALPAAATFADARLERQSVSAPVSHAESRSDTTCRSAHLAECALCQIMSRASEPAAQASSRHATVIVVEQPAIAEISQHALAGRSRLDLARAPPLS